MADVGFNYNEHGKFSQWPIILLFPSKNSCRRSPGIFTRLEVDDFFSHLGDVMNCVCFKIHTRKNIVIVLKLTLAFSS
jgi:hypothetical protein